MAATHRSSHLDNKSVYARPARKAVDNTVQTIILILSKDNRSPLVVT